MSDTVTQSDEVVDVAHKDGVATSIYFSDTRPFGSSRRLLASSLPSTAFAVQDIGVCANASVRDLCFAKLLQSNRME